MFCCVEKHIHYTFEQFKVRHVKKCLLYVAALFDTHLTMKIGYGFRRNAKDLEALGAEKVWIDISRDRPERSDMFKLGGLREGDTLLLLSLRDLGGSPPADTRWKAEVEKMGVTIEIAQLDKPPARMGRPKVYKPTPDQFRRHRAIWLDPLGGTYESKRKQISADYGSELTRGILNGRFGWLDAEKPIPPDMDKEAD